MMAARQTGVVSPIRLGTVSFIITFLIQRERLIFTSRHVRGIVPAQCTDTFYGLIFVDKFYIGKTNMLFIFRHQGWAGTSVVYCLLPSFYLAYQRNGRIIVCWLTSFVLVCYACYPSLQML